MKHEKKVPLKNQGIHALCMLACAVFMYPLFLMLKKSVAVNGLKNYALVLEGYPLYVNLLNSYLIVGTDEHGIALFPAKDFEAMIKKAMELLSLKGDGADGEKPKGGT